MFLLLMFTLAAFTPGVLHQIEQGHVDSRRALAELAGDIHLQIQATAQAYRGFTQATDTLIESLEEAELLLAYYKQQREPGLILKDVGGADGTLDVARLRRNHRELRAGLVSLGLEAEKAALTWRLARRDYSPHRLSRARDRRSALGNLAADAATRISAFLDKIEGIRPGMEFWIRRAPLVASPIPQVLARVPEQMDKTLTAGRELAESLTRLAAPAAGAGG